MSAAWYVERDGKRSGPFSPAQLKEQADRGQLQPTDLVLKEGMGKSVPAAKVKGLFSDKLSPPSLPTQSESRTKPNDQRIATWVFGSLLLTFFLGVFLFAPAELPEFKQRMLAFSSAILAGLFGFFFTGAIHLELKVVKQLFGDLGVKATGGSALFVLVLVWWLSPLAPVKPSLALKSIQFFPENNQISVIGKDVQTILYSFDGKSWKEARTRGSALSKETGFVGLEQLNGWIDPAEKKAHTEVYIKYVSTDGTESKVQKFAYDPNKSLYPPSVQKALDEAREAAEKIRLP